MPEATLQLFDFTKPAPNIAYVPIQPIAQVKGFLPGSNMFTLFKVDQNEVVVEKADLNLGWKPVSFEQNFARLDGSVLLPSTVRPTSFEDTISEEDAETILTNIVNSGMFKRKTSYLIIGDEPGPAEFSVDLKKQMSAIDYEGLKSLLTFIPRMYLYPWYDKNVFPKLPVDYDGDFGYTDAAASVYGQAYLRKKKRTDDIIWDAFLDVFNEVNLAYCASKMIDPWSWEDEKLNNYYVAESEEGQNLITDIFAQYDSLNDPQATELLTAYTQIPKIADTGLEITRQNAVLELLKRKEYATVKAIIDAYRYAQYTELGEALLKPIPFDIVSEDGRVVKATVT